MSKSIPTYLRLFQERTANASPAAGPMPASLTDLCQTFEQATGWSLRYAPGPPPDQDLDLMWSTPVNPGTGVPPGHLRIDLGGTALAEQGPRVDLDVAGELAGAVGLLLSELVQTQQALRDREAELAAGVPLRPQAEGEERLADRLQAALRSGAQAVSCQAAALYLLDGDTTELKLRSSWGLPAERLTAPARPLRLATADLEALAGHAVVLEDPLQHAQWAPPENWPAAVCVPVSSPTTPLGTLWLFSYQSRAFSDQEVNVIEVVAGRLAADLEREMLMAEGVAGAKLKKQAAAAERWQSNQLPRISPLLEGWSVAGWTQQAAAVGGAFHDWFMRADDTMALVLGQAQATDIEAALSAGAVRAALRAHGEYHADPKMLLERVNRLLWTGSAGDQLAHLFYATVEPDGRLRYSMAGQAGAIVLGADGLADLIGLTGLPLGLDPDARYERAERRLSAGQVLLLTTSGNGGAAHAVNRPWNTQQLGEALLPHLALPADALVDLARDRLQMPLVGCPRQGQTVLVLKRLPVANKRLLEI